MIDIDPADMKSEEERNFYAWLLEAERHGLIGDIEYHGSKKAPYKPHTFILSERTTTTETVRLKSGKEKTKEKFLLGKHGYTPDFTFTVPNRFTRALCPPTGKVWVDTKGTYNRGEGSFSINKKWVFQRFNVFINKVVPEKLFRKTWVPERARLTPVKREPVKKYRGVPDIRAFMKKRNV